MKTVKNSASYSYTWDFELFEISVEWTATNISEYDGPFLFASSDDISEVQAEIHFFETDETFKISSDIEMFGLTEDMLLDKSY